MAIYVQILSIGAQLWLGRSSCLHCEDEFYNVITPYCNIPSSSCITTRLSKGYFGNYQCLVFNVFLKYYFTSFACFNFYLYSPVQSRFHDRGTRRLHSLTSAGDKHPSLISKLIKRLKYRKERLQIQTIDGM